MARQENNIKVFEYSRLRVGQSYDGIIFSEEHYLSLIQYQTRLGHSKFFDIRHKSVHFTQYVGVLRIGNLTIEILPKIDQYASLDKDQVQGILLDLLKYCKILHLETVPNSLIHLQKHSILDIYMAFFVHEVEKILHYGLFRSYSRYPKNSSVLKGQLLIEKQIRHNQFDHTKFYCQQFEYDFDHPFNRIIQETLKACFALSPNYYLRQKIKFLLKNIPKEVGIFKPDSDFQLATKDKKTHRYPTVLTYAKIILEQLAGNFRTGKLPLVGLFFDMNLLFEQFIYISLKKLESEELSIKNQVQKHFWGKRKIRPDIVFTYQNQRYIFDTKWKVLQNAKPSIEDLKQIFIYCQYFDASKGVLIYPKILKKNNQVEDTYHPYPEQKKSISCQILSVDLIKDHKLNMNIGRDILKELS